MTLIQLDEAILKIIRNHLPDGETSYQAHIYVETVHRIYEGKDEGIKYNYKIQFFIGRRHYSCLAANLNTPQQLIKKVKEMLNPKPAPKGKGVVLTESKPTKVKKAVDHVRKAVTDNIKNIIGVLDYKDTDLLKDLGFDDLDSVEFIMNMERDLQMSIPDEIAEPLLEKPLGDMIDKFKELLNSK